MNPENPDIAFDRATPGVPGRLVRLSPLVRRIVADNPGPMTFTGTCTYVVGNGDVVVIDPGPDSAPHRNALLEGLGGETVSHILITHTHRDHSAGAPALKAATGAKIVGGLPHNAPAEDGAARAEAAHDRTYRPDAILKDGDAIIGSGVTLTAVATPGHTANHFAFALSAERVLFSGDHVMAWATSVVIPPDGGMGAYMASLEKLLGRDETHYWPGHGGGVAEPQRFVRSLIAHRKMREAAILAQLREGAREISTLVAAIYPELDPALRGAAALSVFAHLLDLEARGLVRADGAPEIGAGYRLA